MAKILEHLIRISGDNKKLKSTIQDSDKLLKGSTSLVKSYTNILNGQLETANKKLFELSKGFKSIQDVDAFKKQADQVKRLKEELQGVQKAGMATATGAGGGGGIRGLASSIGNFLMGIPGVGALLSGAGLAALGVQAFRTRAATAQTGLRLQGLGARGFERSNQRLGFGVQENLQQALALTQEAGGPGGLEDIQALSRVTGVDVQQLISAVGVRRRAGMSQGEAVNSTRRAATIFSQILGKTLDRGRIGEYLQSIDSAVSNLGQGVNVNADAFTKAIATLSRQPTFAANPMRSVGALQAIDATFKTASGATFGMVSDIFNRALRRSGAAVNPLNMTVESRRGLFAEGGIMGGNRMGNIMAAMRDQMRQMGLGGAGTNASNARGLFMQRAFNIPGFDVAKALGDAIARGDLVSMKKISEAIKDESPEKLQKDALEVMRSTDAGILTIEATLQDILDDLGDKIAPAVIAIAETLTGHSFETMRQFGARVDQTAIETDDRSAMRFVNRMKLEGTNPIESGLGQRGALTRMLGPERGKMLSENQLEDIRSTLITKIGEEKGLLGGATDKSQVEKLNEAIDLLNGYLKQTRKLIVNIHHPGGRTQSVHGTAVGAP